MNVSALYIHIPFCARRCPYCDFAVSVNRNLEFRAAYIEALKTEIAGQIRGHEVVFQTIFCGGGTPTELLASQLNELLDSIRQDACIAPDAEISLEANPENLSPTTLQELRAGGWNRLSLGAQSFDDATLSQLGRAHDGAKIQEVVKAARVAGFDNISLDLIYGAPIQSLAAWTATVESALELQTEHISAYSLTIENGTAFGKWEEQGRLRAQSEDAMADRMEVAEQLIEGAGLRHYEVGSWGRPGRECRHNQNYWRGGNYLAAGCGAHGHLDGERWWNERDAKHYISRIEKEGHARAGWERLDDRARLIERIATGVRTLEGFKWDEKERTELKREVEQLQQLGALRIEEGFVRVEKSHLALADGLAARLIGHIK